MDIEPEGPPNPDSGRFYSAQGVAARIGGGPGAIGRARREGRITPELVVDTGDPDRPIYVFPSSEMHRYARVRQLRRALGIAMRNVGRRG